MAIVQERSSDTCCNGDIDTEFCPFRRVSGFLEIVVEYNDQSSPRYGSNYMHAHIIRFHYIFPLDVSTSVIDRKDVLRH